MFFNYLKCYFTIRVAAQFWKVSEPTYQSIILKFIDYFMKCPAYDNIKWENRKNGDKIYFLPALYIQSIIDGFCCRIINPQGHTNEYYSGKEKDFSLRYLLGINLKGKIIFLYGGEPGSNNDLNLFDKSNLINSIDENEFILGDGGFRGRVNFVVTQHTQNLEEGTLERLVNTALCSRRAMVEQIIQRIRVFGIAKERYRGKNFGQHSIIIKIICNLVNLEFFCE